MCPCLNGISTLCYKTELLRAVFIELMTTKRKDRLAFLLHTSVFCSQSWPLAVSRPIYPGRRESSVPKYMVCICSGTMLYNADCIVCCSYQCLRMTNFLSQPTIEAIQTLLVIGNVLSYNMNPGISYVLLGKPFPLP